MAILIKSTKYFGKEIKGKTTTLWDVYKSKLQVFVDATTGEVIGGDGIW